MNQDKKPVELKPPEFNPTTIINALPDCIQVIIPYAPQVSMVVVLTLEQVVTALKQSAQLRGQGKIDQAAIDAMLRRKDLKVV